MFARYIKTLNNKLPEPDLIFQVVVASPNSGFTYGLTRAFGQMLIDWGDGLYNKYTFNNARQHTYADAGTYTVRVWSRGMSAFTGAAGTVLDVENLKNTPVLTSLDLVFGTYTGTLSSCVRFPMLQTLNVHGFDEGDISDLAPLVHLIRLRVTRSVGDSIKGNLSELGTFPALRQFTGSHAELVGDVGELVNRADFQIVICPNSGLSVYTPGTLSSTLSQMVLFNCAFDEANLGSLVDALYDVRSTLASLPIKQYLLHSNPGSAAVAVSHATKISEMQAAGLTITI